MTELKLIPLADIDMISNYRDVEPVTPTDADVIELSNSIKANGLLQAVLVRPHPAQAGRYELIFGHRRNVAAGLAGLKKIPANVKDVSDEEILELQITENLQRKDVHPLDEAIAFGSLIRDRNYTVEDIAARFGKKLEFVVHRLKLTDLLLEFHKAFKKNLLSVGQAFVICRLRQEDQKRLRKEYKDEEFQMTSIGELQDWISRNLLHQLSSARFKKDDSTLVPKAGPCTTCQKRSGCANLLFTDLKDDDRCFDADCFGAKQDAFFMRQLQDTIENKPKVHLIADDPGKLPAAVKKLIKDMSVPILDDSKYKWYSTGKYKGAVKALRLDGNARGEITTIYVEVQATAKAADGTPAKRTVKAIEEEIAGINQRAGRKIELDSQKIWEPIKKQLDDPAIFRGCNLNYTTTLQAERNAMAYALIKKMNGDFEDEAVFAAGLTKSREDYWFGFDDDEDGMKFENWKVTEEQLTHLLRLFTIHELKGGISPAESEGARVLMPMIKLPGYKLDKFIDELEAEQAEETKKRTARTEKRITALEAEKKELESQVKEKADKKAASTKGSKAQAKKKGGKSAPPKARVTRKNHLGQELTTYGLPVTEDDKKKYGDQSDDVGTAD